MILNVANDQIFDKDIMEQSATLITPANTYDKNIMITIFELVLDCLAKGCF